MRRGELVGKRASQSDLQKIRDTTDLVALIGEHVALKPKGREHVGLCPFHDDHDPSMHVVTHKEQAFYKCFSCGASGDAIRFVMEYQRMSFGEAVRFLADRAGIELTGEAFGETEQTNDGPDRVTLQRAIEYAVRRYQEQLEQEGPDGTGRTTIAQRGINDDMVERFQLGVANAGGSWLADQLSKKRSAMAVAEAAGLIKRRPSDGSAYDSFRKRLIFPICDQFGKPIALGGRVLDPDDQPKYLNSAENALFHKSRTLYGLDLAKRAIVDSGQAIVVEGYTDVIACHQAGVENVVGTLGTALTDEHAKMLSRFCEDVVLVFDGDEAGQRAADRGVEVFFRHPVDIRICVLPDDKDPDELMHEPGGEAAFRDAVANADDALSYKLARFRQSIEGAAGLSARQKRLEAFLQELGRLGLGCMSGVRKRLVMARLSDLLDLPMNELVHLVPKSKPAPRSAPAVVEATPRPEDEAAPAIDASAERLAEVSRARRLAEEWMLAVVLYEPSSLAQGADAAAGLDATLFEGEPNRSIAASLFSAAGGGLSFTMQDVLSALASETARATASRLYFEGEKAVEEGHGGDASAALREASESLHACREREAYLEKVRRRRQPGEGERGKTEEDGGLQSLMELLEARNQQGHVPALIKQGVRP